MNPLTSRIFFLGLVSIFCSCTKQRALHQDFTLKINQRASISTGSAKLNIKFSALVQDSRCPPGAYCTWAGKAIIALEINDSTVTLGDTSMVYDYGTHQIQLKSVDYPIKRTFGKERHCTITLRVD
jgi:hypothetical protein